uniref:Uncharacterized protein n=1 Tax=Tetranychus urticae TaxID=32264 RepID=T1JY29_TETUR
MSSSIQNEKYEEFAIDLVDLPLSIPSKSANIHATLTDASGVINNKYFIQESISASGASIKGKIVISSEKDSYNVYYDTDLSLNKDRLVIHGTNCVPFTFKNNWDETLPGVKRPVTNLVLLMGPSILYRLDHSSIVWKSVADKNIRGTMMKGATTQVKNKLRITYYYKKNFDEGSGIKNPSRIEFSGYDPTSVIYKENLILDIYLQNENYYDELANEVHPLPGIGCPYYLSTSPTPFPELRTDYVHYTMYEYIQGSSTSRTFSEIHASKKRHQALLRLKATLLGVTTEAIYDYQLGVSYLFEEGESCRISSADLNSPGIGSDVISKIL